MVQNAVDEKSVVERQGGVGELLCRELGGFLELVIRVTVVGQLQRDGYPATFDRFVGSRFGVKAVEPLEAGAFSRIVCPKGRPIASVPIEDGVRSLSLIDSRAEMARHAEALGIMLGR